MTDTDDIMQAFRRIPIVSDEEAGRRRRELGERDQLQTRRHIAEASRRKWNAPERHVAAHVSFDGPWGQRWNLIRSGLGKGSTWALCGLRGNGKTQLAVQAMIETTDQGRTALYTSAVRFFAEIKATYRRDAKDTELDVVERHRKPGLLVIDEVGKRGESVWEGNLLFELFNNRYADRSDTIVIANLSPQDLAENLGASLTSRLNETGGVIHCDWPGRR
jgi:hypothetical protein